MTHLEASSRSCKPHQLGRQPTQQLQPWKESVHIQTFVCIPSPLCFLHHLIRTHLDLLQGRVHGGIRKCDVYCRILLYHQDRPRGDNPDPFKGRGGWKVFIGRARP